MPRLVTKFKYMKPGSGGKSMGGYAKYIATREGVEKIDDSQRHAPATIKQQKLIMCILRDFPDTKESHEYEDYRREKTIGNASEFITRALEENMDQVADSKTYADYIATRPRAERFGSHGLFTDDGVQVQLNKVSQELNAYTGHVYTTILSLRREDAARLGFDNGSRWRNFLRSQTTTLSENLKIPIDHLRWYAAYHDEGHHPHIHMIAYSTVPGEGYLSDKGVEKMRSTFARDIFSQDLLHTYEHQTEIRNQLREQGRESVAEIVTQINRGSYRLGSMNMTGTGTEMDLKKARYYFEKAAELGNADALYGLGKLYLKPEFSGYDPPKAVEFLEQAAAKENAFAKYQLGKLLCQGELVPKDIARGLPMLEELAEKSNCTVTPAPCHHDTGSNFPPEDFTADRRSLKSYVRQDK